jgi:polyhydroxybutyrate depolymerase
LPRRRLAGGLVASVVLGALVVPTLVGGQRTAMAATVSTAGAGAAGAGSPGCGHPPVPGPTAGAVPGGDVVESLSVTGMARSYRLAVPAHYRSTTPTPLVLVFHGSGSDAVQTSLYTQLPARGGRAGYLVATPDAIGGRWDLSGPDARTPDLAYVHALIASLSSRYCVDRHRIYAAGISLGSEFAAIVGCTSSDGIAAVGLVAAEFPLRPCRSPLPVIAFHGTADPIVPYRSGGTGQYLPGVPSPGAVQNLSAWARLDRCAATPELRRVATMVVRRTWARCRKTSSVVLYSVLGGGHTWPGSPVTLSAGTFGPTTRQISATGLMLAFFGRFRLGR